MSTIPTTRALLSLCAMPTIKRVRNWWLRKVEDHYLICAATEAKRAKEAQQNVAYYQKRAALARSARI